jgi:hypothetical protein
MRSPVEGADGAVRTIGSGCPYLLIIAEEQQNV